MADEEPILLATIAQELLDATVQVLRDGGRDIPPRVFIEIGEVTAPVELDGCTDQLTCFIPELTPSFFTEGFQRRQGMMAAATQWQAHFNITLLRCHQINESGIPDPDVTNAQAAEHLKDGWQLLRGLSWNFHKGTLVPSFKMRPGENCHLTAFKCIPPRGGIRGWDWSFNVSVHDQYAPEGLSAV